MSQTPVPSGSSRHYSLLFVTPSQRSAIHSLYQFQQHISRVIDQCSDANTAQHKLAWWQAEVARLFQDAARHPLSQQLQHVLQQHALPESLFQNIIEAAEMDLTYSRYRTFTDLVLYCETDFGALQQLVSQVLGGQKNSAQAYAKTLGSALQLSQMLRDLHRHGQRGRIYIPIEELEQFNIQAEQLLQPSVTPPDALAKLLALQAQRIHQQFQTAVEQLPSEARYAQRSGLVLIKLHQTLLDEMQQANYPLLQQRISLTPLR
ncbi:MAG: squalene/phytoene synthase family protein, partial [Gammaproteobacteria bacterium]|nr:squalene/phytoene synthase family protein [Gammaproteobacteria bacterium]